MDFASQRSEETTMSILFEPMTIKNMELRNRFVRSATYDKFSDERGHVTDKRIKLFADLADGGVGLIITGLTYVHPSGQLAAFESSLATDDCIPGLKRLTAAVHDRGAKIAVQLYHTGRENARFLKAKGQQALAPSFVPNDPYFTQDYRQMTEEELWEIIEAFGDAAKRAREAEFDAIQVHAAHVYLLSQFLSPFTNRRQDAWGGTLIERLRLHREIYRNIREKAGEDYQMLVKIGVQDGFSDGLEFSEGEQAAQLLAQWGFDALEISHGLRGKSYKESEFPNKINSIEREAYFRPWCRKIRGLVDVPIMMVGGLRTFKLMEEVVKSGDADFISLSRPLIREPGIINEWKRGNRGRPACISCNQCLEALRKGDDLRCIQESLERKG
jgi:2,4-dienoyl-CoA reductase-like NADH-dependent reductase (Old Yellow Enzyme family)